MATIEKEIFRLLTTRKNEGWSFDDLWEKLSGFTIEEVKKAMFTVGNEYENIRLILDCLEVHVAFVTGEEEEVKIPDRHFEMCSGVWTVKQIVGLIVDTDCDSVATNQVIIMNDRTVLHWLCYFNDAGKAMKWMKQRNDVNLTLQDTEGKTVLDISPKIISWEIMTCKLHTYHEKIDEALRLIEEAAEIHHGLARLIRNNKTMRPFWVGFVLGMGVTMATMIGLFLA